MRNRMNKMRRRYSALAIASLLIGVFAGCMPASVPIPVPIPSGYVLLPVEFAPPIAEGSSAETAYTAAETDDTAAEEVTAAAEEVASDTDGSAEVESGDDAPPPMAHRLQGREECIECHAADDDRSPSPADHAAYTDAVCLFCHIPEEGEAVMPALPEEAEPEFCLACHGPFEDLSAVTADTLVDELGILGNPHMHVPHDGDKILSCDKCHDVHPIPLTPEDVVPEANIQYCYAACHHETTFEACSACHNE